MRIDAAVIGAGPAGCAAAIRLALAGARVILVRVQASPGYKPGEVLSSTARMTISELGLVESFAGLGFPALAGSLSVWDEPFAIEREGMVDPFGLGALIDRRQFEDWLALHASRCGVTVCDGGRDLKIEPDRNGWTIEFRHGGRTPVKAPVIIEATGRSSGLLGNGHRSKTDNLVALQQYGVRREQSIDQRMLIEASEHGWWYAAPLPDNKAVVAFLTDADILEKNRKAFVCNELATTHLIRDFVDQLIALDHSHGHPANSSIRTAISGTNWVAVGDAAATYDPLSGHGIATALAKGTAIARLIVNGASLPDSLAAYTDAERLAFASYLRDQQATYARAAARFRSGFWTRRIAPTSLTVLRRPL